MKKSHVVTALLAVTLLLAACGGPTPTPTTVSLPFLSAEGGFSIVSPAPLTATIEIGNSDSGDIELHTFQGEIGGLSYQVAYWDYPSGYATVDPTRLLASARDAQVNGTKGTLVSETEITLSGVNGREIRINAQAEDGQKVVVRGRLYWAPTRLYRVLVIAPEGRADDAAVTAFFESFRLFDRPT